MEFSKVLSLSWLAIFFWSTISLYKGMHRGLFLNIPLSSNTPWGAQIQGSFVICCHVFKLCFSSLNTTCKKQPSERCNWNIQCYEMYFGTMKRVMVRQKIRHFMVFNRLIMTLRNSVTQPGENLLSRYLNYVNAN